MISLFLKLLIPTAQALSINGFFKAPVPVQAFAGRYEAIECPQASESEVSVTVDASGVTVGDSHEQIAKFGELADNGYGQLKSVTPDQGAMKVVTNTLTLKDDVLTVESKSAPVLSRGRGVTTETCVLKRVK